MLAFGLSGALVTVSDRETSNKGRPGSFFAPALPKNVIKRWIPSGQAAVRWATGHDQPAVRREKNSLLDTVRLLSSWRSYRKVLLLTGGFEPETEDGEKTDSGKLKL